MPTAPFPVIAGPASPYIAPEGEAFPDVDEAPAGNWASLGYTDGGVTVTHNQTQIDHMVDQVLATLKVTRETIGLTVAFNLAELTIENFGRVIGNSVSDTAAGSGTPGYRTVGLGMDVDVPRFSMLIRGPSPYMDGNLQYELPVVVQSGEPAVTFSRSAKATLSTTWKVLADPDAVSVDELFGRLLGQDAVAL